MKYFGSSGIRGLTNEKITPDLALKVGKAVGKEYKDIVIARDPRPSGQMLGSALISGAASMGASITRIGILPTPTLAYAARNFDCGIMVTASHNPAPYNGIKLWNPDGSSFNTPQMERIERAIDGDPDLAPWDKVGTVHENPNAVREHMDLLLDKMGTDHTLKVVIDCANGAGCVETPFLLREMGCEVIALNSNPNGFFPAHDPEPTEKNLADLGRTVKNTGADLGIAHDGDADRLVAFDKNGNYLGGDILLALFASQYNEKIAVPINSSMVLEDIVDEVIRTRVGDVYVAEKLKEERAQFGGEPSGTWIFPEISYAPDAVYGASLLVKMFEELDIEERIADLPSYPTKRGAFKTQKKEETMRKLEEKFRKDYDETRLNFIDGIRVEYQDGWVLIRKSGTEPKIRITAEAKDEKSLDKIFKENETILKEEI
ncbi:MAG: phosphoglucosamine mutase [Thermoplasmata archaeon]